MRVWLRELEVTVQVYEIGRYSASVMLILALSSRLEQADVIEGPKTFIVEDIEQDPVLFSVAKVAHSRQIVLFWHLLHAPLHCPIHPKPMIWNVPLGHIGVMSW